jgi:predicted histidine transporter YuiF (NhaC family)
MGGITLVCTILMPCKPIILFPVAIGSILLGVAFDALTDRTMDRNLFPIEMIIWAGISTPGILAGNLTGCLVYWIKKKLHNQALHATSEPAPGAASSSHEG